MTVSRANGEHLRADFIVRLSFVRKKTGDEQCFKTYEYDVKHIYIESATLAVNKAMPPQNAAFATNCSGLNASFCMAMIGNADPHDKARPCICCFVATFLESNVVTPWPINAWPIHACHFGAASTSPFL